MMNAERSLPLPSTSRGTSVPEETPATNVNATPMSSILTLKTATYKKALPVEKKLEKMIQKLRKKEDSYATRLDKALKLSENPTFKKFLTKFSSKAAMFTVMPFREKYEDEMGRRFNKTEKIMALSLYIKGCTAYRWLSKVFVLPSPVTLRKLISKAQIKPGINKKIFLQLKKRAQKMTKKEKLSMLLFDEIAISPQFSYNQRKDLITGFFTNGNKEKRVVADHALVFMLRGAVKNYKQPIAYTFYNRSTPQQELSFFIKTLITELQNCGLKVLATVCDHSTRNLSVINSLIKETKEKYIKNNENFKHENTFEVNGERIIPIFDPSHLIKSVRNNLIVKHLKCTIDNAVKIAKWDHIVRLYEKNPAYRGIRLVKNLTEIHVNPKKKAKIKVKYATQIFSKTVGVYLGFLAIKGILPEDCKDTADVLFFFDNLFDSMNGSYISSRNRSEKPLLRPVTPKSEHSQIWSKSKKILQSAKFITKEGREGSVPSIINWIRTLDNIELLKNTLFSLNVKSFYMRNFNLDPLENFFAYIPNHGYRNISPSPSDFESAFTSLLINNMTSNHSPKSNCEEDFCKMLQSMDCLL